MNLFDSIERRDKGPALHLEDSFSYYNRSARVGVAKIRAVLQEWFERYSSPDQPELAARIRADFQPAFFELFLHELGLRLGVNVSVHPYIGDGISTRPDFLLNEAGCTAYLEARVARDESLTERKERRVVDSLYDQINALEIHDYFLHISELEVLTGHQPSARRLKKEIQKWLGSLNYEQVLSKSADLKSLDENPRLDYEDDHIRVTISAIPVSKSRRGQPGHRPIGIYPMESRWGGSEKSLRKALSKKGVKYGKPDAPYLIAVNSLSSWGFDRIEHMEALFGSEQYVIGLGENEPAMVRKPNGFWAGASGPQHTRVSGVLFCQVTPWNIHEAKVCLYHNPFAVRPYEGSLLQLPQATPTQNKMEWKDGVSLGTIFGIEPDWHDE